jgi:uncharacterized protein (TIGR02145 family)
MAQNLNYADSIVSPAIKTGSRCHGDNPDNCETYGRSYKWGTAMDSAAVFTEGSKGCGWGKMCSIAVPARGICPEGWHIPTPDEWEALFSAMGSSPAAMQAKGFENLPVIEYSWGSMEPWANATDAYGFSALPDGCSLDDYFGYEACFWGAAERSENRAFTWGMSWNYAGFDDDAYSGNHKGNDYDPIRCVKD